MKRGATLLVMMFFLVGLVTAGQSLGVFKQNSVVNLIQGCEASSYSNITKILYPNSSLALNVETPMLASGDIYSYSFNNTEPIGTYLVYGHCDESSVDTPWVYDFEITFTGGKVSLSNGYIVLALLFVAGLFLTLSFAFAKEHWILRTFFLFSSVGMGVISINAAKIIASESAALESMGTTGLTLGIVILGLFFLYIFVYAFIEIMKVFKEKRGLRWDY